MHFSCFSCEYRRFFVLLWHKPKNRTEAMKHIYGLAVVMAMMTTACGGKHQATAEEEQQRILQIDSVDAASGLQRMKVSQFDEQVKIAARDLHITLTRQPDENAPTVKSEVGTYVDNQVTLRITRADGSQWVNRTLHKSDFAALTGEAYARHFILEGMVYDEERSNTEKMPVFAASICVPMSDLYIPFVVRVTAGGDVQVVRDEDMDVLPDINPSDDNP
jgi:hypothetical protein